MNNVTAEKWNLLHTQKRFRPKYPSETVVQFMFQNFANRMETSVLDLGCGAGRHSFFMAQEGFQVMAADISQSGINYINDLKAELKLENLNTRVTPATKLPFDNNKFHACVCYGVLYYMNSQEIKQAFDEIYRVLTINGKALIVVRSTSDHRFGIGKKIEDNTFIIQENDPSKASYNETGMVMHFFTKEELNNLTSSFSQVSIDTAEETLNNGELLESNFILRVMK